VSNLDGSGDMQIVDDNTAICNENVNACKRKLCGKMEFAIKIYFDCRSSFFHRDRFNTEELGAGGIGLLGRDSRESTIGWEMGVSGEGLRAIRK
jgi:hypothetical protein